MITLANVTRAEALHVLPGWAWDHREQRMPTEPAPLESGPQNEDTQADLNPTHS